MAEEADDQLRQPPAIPPTHRLLTGPPYDAFEELQGDLNSWAKTAGLGFVKLRVSNDVKDFGPTRIGLVCDRGGRQRDSKANIRRTTTQKTGCAWEGVAKALKVNDRRWTFEVLKDSYVISSNDVRTATRRLSSRKATLTSTGGSNDALTRNTRISGFRTLTSSRGRDGRVDLARSRPQRQAQYHQIYHHLQQPLQLFSL